MEAHLLQDTAHTPSCTKGTLAHGHANILKIYVGDFAIIDFFLVLFASSLSFQEDDIACFLGNDNSNCRCDIKNLLFYSLVNKSMKMIIVLKQNKGGKRYELSKAYLMSDIIIGYI